MRILVALALAVVVVAAAQTPSASAAPAINPELPTVFVAGDSTANNTDRKGWGDPFADYFDPAKINVLNRARAGRSARTFLAEGLWDRIVADVRPGDYVIIQFGHNDGGAPDKPPYRGDLPGVGDETTDIAGRDGKPETIHTFGWYIRKFVNDTKARNAHPIVMSLTVRNIWKDGKVERGSGQFGMWSRQVAEAEKVPFVDLTTIIADAYDKMGEAQVKELFPADHTHTSPHGADMNAAFVIAGLKGIRSPLAQFVSAKGESVAAAPAVEGARRQPMPANPDLPTIWLIGDSTVRNGRGDGGNGQWGWGEPIVDLFDSTKVNVVNRAVGGLSSRTFYTGPYWKGVLAMLKPGDFVIMQFGHNDGGNPDDPARHRASLPGVGDESKVYGAETVHTFGWYLKTFVADTRAKGATPIVCSLIPRMLWKDQRIIRNSEDYGKWAGEVAMSEHTPFIDLNEIIARHYDQLGPEKVKPLFADPHTHTSREGAELNAAAVIEGLKALRNDPVAQYLNGKAAEIAPYRP
jgi:lysophospholipase L1-like esterase